MIATSHPPKRAFHPVSLYPELAPIMAALPVLRAEALYSLERGIAIDDARVTTAGGWRVAPLWAEEDDREVFPDLVCEQNRRLAPTTTALLAAVPAITAAAFSGLAAGAELGHTVMTSPS